MDIAVFSILGLLAVYSIAFFLQEKMIFLPQRLDKNHRFNFDQEFEELNLSSYDGTVLNSLLFKTTNPKGLIFYLHGNGGCLSSWGEVASTYTGLNYDVFLLDYRGYGKSDGAISSEKQLSLDVQVVYDELKKKYAEDQIIVLGYSLGTGLAVKLAAANNPNLLILQAPFFSLKNIILRRCYWTIPPFILKYKFETNRYIDTCKMPIVLFHGVDDEVIPYKSSLMLQAQLKPNDLLITLHGQGHRKMTENLQYQAELGKILWKQQTKDSIYIAT